MSKDTLFIGLDVHANSISIAVAGKEGPAHYLKKITNKSGSIRPVFRAIDA